MKDFNYNQLISFVQVAQHLNISTAAQHLNKNRATISEHIETLEFDLGHKLFERSSRQIKLTAFGKKVLQPSVLLTRQIYTWQNTLENVCPSADKVVLKIAYDTVVPKSYIKELINHANIHDMDIEFVAMSSNIATELLNKNIVDLIITPDEEETLLKYLEWKIIGSMPYRFYAHKDLFNSESVELSTLLNQTQLLPRAYLNKNDDEKFIFTPKNKIINDMDLLKCALINKIGWAFLPVHMAADQWDDIIEVETKLGREGFITPILARWRPGEEILVSPILDYFTNGNTIHA